MVLSPSILTQLNGQEAALGPVTPLVGAGAAHNRQASAGSDKGGGEDEEGLSCLLDSGMGGMTCCSCETTPLALVEEGGVLLLLPRIEK